MNPSLQPDPELRELVDRCLNGTLDDLARFRLEVRLREEEAALAYYLEMISNDALLAPALRGEMASDLIREIPVKPRFRSKVILSLAAVLALLATASVLLSRRPPERSDSTAATERKEPAVSPSVPVRITGLVGVRTNGEDTFRLAQRPAESHIGIDAGLLELTFDQGTLLIVEGPANLEVTGPNSCRLIRGKAVAKVPPQARGFTIAYQEGRLVDHGTEFALEVDDDGRAREVGVFRGEVELFDNKRPRGFQLFKDYAVRRTEEGLMSATFDRDRFVRELPTREFSWDMTDTPLDQLKDFQFDITPLMRGPGEFRTVFRHLAGGDGITIRRVELRCDGRLVASSDATGHTGAIHLPGRFNDYLLTVPPEAWKSGHWELAFRAHSLSAGMAPRPSTSQGIVCFEEGLSVEANAENFLGSWAYSHAGSTFVREIRADGTAVLYRDGQLMPAAVFEAKWTLKDSVLEMHFTAGADPEKHFLRDIDTLIFLSKPYRNAHRVISADR